MNSLIRKSAYLAFFATTFLSFGACTDDSVERASHFGTLGLRLDVGGHAVNVVRYVIRRGGVTVATNDLDVAALHSLSFRIGGLLQGSDYDISLEATSEDGLIGCRGSAPFSVEAGRITNVHVVLNCSSTNPTTGSIDINGNFNHCPKLRSLVVSPLIALVGETIGAQALFGDLDGDPVSYVWADESGVFGTEANASYICPFTLFPPVLTVRASDGKCTSTESVTVECLGLVLGFCGDGFVDIGEECDDGNLDNTDACPNDCTLPFCGDADLEGSEICDDGNIFSGDGCSAQCLPE